MFYGTAQFSHHVLAQKTGSDEVNHLVPDQLHVVVCNMDCSVTMYKIYHVT